MTKLPTHLKRYIVTQDYSRYTPEDHAVWRYILRQLRAFLTVHAHPCYLDGLKKTGISIDRIPKIEDIDRHIQEFGWQAVPVSGFIPPAAFMELQAYGFLPIACDMRTVGHLMYTPAPDIVHEAAGHAPILVDPDFAAYLKKYAQVARRAIISKQDMDQYEAIRVLSDMKEHPDSTPDDIKKAEERLAQVSQNITHISEAARLGRMNWWTAEYGLIGSLENPRIFGAGLLSSVGEARGCLQPNVRKIPLTVECVEYGYDITEPQPQLFVTPDFQTLTNVLEQFADTMAFRQGGVIGLEKALAAETVNTVELDSGLQIGGKLAKWIPAQGTSQGPNQEIGYLQFQGPTQLALAETELLNHGTRYHSEGFGTPIGFLKGRANRTLAQFSDDDLRAAGIQLGQHSRLEFESGVVVAGRATGWLRSPQGALLVISFQDCTVTLGEQVLFRPEWGTFDMGVGARVVSVFGGPADREAYGLLDDFVAKRVPAKAYDQASLRRFDTYQALRDLRDKGCEKGNETDAGRLQTLETLVRQIEAEHPSEWLMKLEALEIATQLPSTNLLRDRLRRDLEAMAQSNAEVQICVTDGLKLADVK